MIIACPYCKNQVDVTGVTGAAFKCPHCARQVNNPNVPDMSFLNDPSGGEPAVTHSTVTHSFQETGGSRRRYASLLRVQGWLRVFAWVLLVFYGVIGVLELLAAVMTGVNNRNMELLVIGVVSSVILVLIALFQFVLLTAAAEFLTLAMDVEDHARKSKEALERLKPKER